MNNQDLFRRLLIGAVINFIVLYALEQVDNRLAKLYLVVISIVVIVTYRNQIFPSINLLMGMVKGGM